MKKTDIIAAGAAGAALILADGYRYIFYRSRSKLSQLLFEKEGHESPYYSARDEAAAALESRPHEVMTMASDNGYFLNGFYYRAGSGRSKTIAYIVHGYRSNHAETAGLFADYYLDRGIDIFCDDHVASGSSGGKFIGYDYFETADCLKWIDTLKRNFGSDIRIILHGFSMGGATVVNMGDKCPDNVKFIVCDSGYTSGLDAICGTAGAKCTLPFSLLNAVNKFVAGYDLLETDVRPACRHMDVPILFIHGTEDRTVPIEMGRELYGICSSPRKEMLTIDGARHVEAMFRAPEKYTAKLDEYIKEFIV